MFFEGSEKKLEIVFSSNCVDLRQRDWSPVVAKAGAQILSKISSPHCDAYLLSESSLFVWDHRLTMITCGKTTLIHTAIDLFRDYGPENVESFIFQRKNEFFGHQQKSDIFTDLELLSKHIPGRAYRFGDANEHHLFLFHLNKNFNPMLSDQTLEILMYEIQGEASQIFTETPQQPEKIQKLLDFQGPLKGFQIDSHIFKPMGYSCNALKGNEYFTIHVTPQEISPYVSFETNIIPEETPFIHTIIETFQPKSFDLVSFKPTMDLLSDVSNYQMINNVNEEISGYHVNFASYYKPPSEPKKALSLELN